MQRLDRILSEAGVASRKELRAMIRSGRVMADGAVVTEESRKFDETTVCVTVDGRPVRLRAPVLIMLNKPAGYLTAADDPKAKTVMELVPEEYRRLGVMPVGRLDKDTEGLLLLTNDGDLAHRILSPRHGVWKRYYAEHAGQTEPEDVRAFAAGLVLADGLHCLPARLTPLAPGRSVVCVQEGKYHQVRRMLASRGCPVTYLRREAEGGLTLGELPLGQTKELDIGEAERLFAENPVILTEEKTCIF